MSQIKLSVAHTVLLFIERKTCVFFLFTIVDVVLDWNDAKWYIVS